MVKLLYIVGSHGNWFSEETSRQVEGSPCDAASYDVDDVFLERLERALQGLETLPLEQNVACFLFWARDPAIFVGFHRVFSCGKYHGVFFFQVSIMMDFGMFRNILVYMRFI